MPAQDGGGSVDRLLDELVALERSALDRWIRLDPQGYFDLQAPEVTYFDPFTERRVDGLDAMQLRLAPMKKMKPPSTVRHDRSQGSASWRGSDIQPGQLRKTIPPRSIVGLAGMWKIIHSHWSYIQPELTQTGS